MDVSAIEAELLSGLPQCELELLSEGNKLNLKIVSNLFEGLSRVKRQQKVYGILDDRIKSGEIHAVSMVTLTVDEANQ
jgi:acid stress-induced BolA-like protein IbaG/YrbA